MPLSPGDKLGPYECISLLGKGGMGEVYRARDPKLNREVAIKILPPALANDPDYLTRFQREAQTLASLNHPNIAAVYGLEENAIVMELVEGDTLRGPLTIQETLPLAKQIAEALEAAHDKGIIHRDLKPGNIKVTPEGVVKVLDFGLAKAVERSTQSGADSPTLSIRATEAGLILGTAGYMSPEQAAGKPVDRRADIWSFGVVLYELLTGKRLFDGETVSHTLAHVLTSNLDLNEIPSGPIRELLRRCLDRNLRNRLSHIAEARIAIENYAPAQAQPQASAPAKTGWWPWAVAAAAVLAAAGLGAWALLREKAAAPPQTVEFEIQVPGGVGSVLVSPDGKTLAWRDDRTLRLWLRPIGSAKVLPTGLENPQSLGWSLDGRWISYTRRGGIQKFEVATGAAQTVASGDFSGALTAWTPDGQILASQARGPILRTGASGGPAVPVFELDRNAGEIAQGNPAVMEDGQLILFRSLRGNTGEDGIYLGRLDGKGSPRRIYPSLPFRYAAPNTLLVRDDTRLMAVRFNPESGQAGEPVLISDNDVRSFSASADGRVLAFSGGRTLPEELSLYDRSGKKLETIPAASPYLTAHVEFSPDGRRLLLERNTGENVDLWTVELGRKVVSRLTFNEASEACGVWSADGQTVYFFSNRPQVGRAIYSIPSNGTGAEKLVHKVQTHHMHASPNGQYLLFERGSMGNGLDYLDLRNGNKPGRYLDQGGGSPQFSPDSKLVAYESSETGRSEIYVQTFPAGGGKWQISTKGGIEPRWRGDGREIIYTDEAGVVYAAAVEVRNGSLEVTSTKELFRFPRGRVSGTAIAVSPDGKLFAIRETPPGGEASITVKLNWPLPAK